MNTKADIRLIVMDMDGTLLNPEGIISKENLTALREAQAKGIHLAICSGRLCGDVGLFVQDAGLEDFHILSLNGAYCLQRLNGKAYASHTLPRAAAEECLRILEGLDVTYGCFWQNRMAFVQSSRALREKRWGTHRKRQGAPEYIQGHEAVREALAAGMAKIVCVEDQEPERLRELHKRLLSVKEIEVTSSWINNLELMPQGVDKGSAVKELAQHLGLTAENVMAIGDYDNDLSMIAYAGCGVAMENATESVKSVAKYITLSNANDGVAEAIGRYAL